MTLKETYDNAKTALLEAGICDAPIDASLFIAHVFGYDKGYLLSHPETELDEEKLKTFNECIEKRIKRIPLQHITGTQDFMGLTFVVNENVLVPRFDTECLVEEALKEIHDGECILDMCTGSGCILTSLLNFSNDCKGVGVDISEDALNVARQNSERILSERTDVSFEYIKSDMFESVDGTFDIIVSNPPYIKTEDIATLAPEVKDFDPIIALDGGTDGLSFYRIIAKDAFSHLRPGGFIFLEIGYDEGEDVSKIMKDNNYTDVEIIKDYAQNDRVVKARRKICLTN